MALSWRVARFLTVAVVAFCVDISVLNAMTMWIGAALWVARLTSLPAATTTAWYLHRRLTFADRRRGRKTLQWGHYLLVNAASGGVNYGVYVILITTSFWMHQHFAVAIVPGALCATLINFTAANLWVYRQ